AVRPLAGIQRQGPPDLARAEEGRVEHWPDGERDRIRDDISVANRVLRVRPADPAAQRKTPSAAGLAAPEPHAVAVEDDGRAPEPRDEPAVEAQALLVTANARV